MKRLLSFSLIALLALNLQTSYAAADEDFQPSMDQSGLLLGAQVGIAHQNAPPQAALSHSIIDDIAPFGGRLYAGYQFNQYIAVQLGYTHIYDEESNGDHFFGPDHYKLNTIDVAAKLMLPIGSHFNVFVTPGVARVHQDVFNQFRVTDLSPLINSNTNKYLAELGGGVGMTLFNRIGLDASYNHVFGSGIINPINFGALGVSVRIG